jgi:hypothetical protein
MRQKAQINNEQMYVTSTHVSIVLIKKIYIATINLEYIDGLFVLKNIFNC